MKVLILAAYALSILYVHFRGRVRHKLSRQLSDHSSFLAPINCLMYLFSKVPNRPYLAPQTFPELQVLVDNWQAIRSEALHLHDAGNIKRSEQYDDIGFNSFFKSGWKRFYLKWYDEAHPSAGQLCPQTTALLRQIPSVKAAMFAELPPGSKLVRHRDPYAGSLRFHLGLFTPNDPACFIEVDGERYHWRDGEAVVFDETFIHYAENATEHNRIILFCDIEAAADPGLGHRLQPLVQPQRDGCRGRPEQRRRPDRRTQSDLRQPLQDPPAGQTFEEAQPQALLPAEMGLLRPGTGFHPVDLRPGDARPR